MSSSAGWPDNPRKMLEARYRAYETGDVDFIVESVHPSVRAKHDRASIESWSRKAEWLGLTVEEEEPASEDKAFIRFGVRYREEGQDIDHRERAEFRRHDGRWFYYDSTFPKREPVRRAADKVGRNDPCSCGSGKKFKKCCGA